MEEILKNLIDRLNSSVFILLVLLGAAFWGVFRIARLVELFSHHKTKIDKFDDLSDKMIELKVKVDLIYQNTNPNRTVASASPISITPSGQEIAVKINANQILQKYLGPLSELVVKTNPQNAYDVQAASMTITKSKMIQLLDANEINSVKGIAFAKGLIVEDVMSIFGVLLRDDILKKKGLPVSDVDKKPKG